MIKLENCCRVRSRVLGTAEHFGCCLLKGRKSEDLKYFLLKVDQGNIGKSPQCLSLLKILSEHILYWSNVLASS